MGDSKGDATAHIGSMVQGTHSEESHDKENGNHIDTVFLLHVDGVCRDYGHLQTDLEMVLVTMLAPTVFGTGWMD